MLTPSARKGWGIVFKYIEGDCRRAYFVIAEFHATKHNRLVKEMRCTVSHKRSDGGMHISNSNSKTPKHPTDSSKLQRLKHNYTVIL